MSGIVGALHLDGRPVPTEELAEAIARMQHRGPDGARTWTGSGIGLGYLAFHTTPEARLERQPQHTAEGHCVLVADARIDNRAELHRDLGLRERLGEMTDADLILAAYERWGEDCAVRLIGDFAFAIWDEPERRLFCARDHAGIRPFYYHYTPGERFVFASEIKGVRAFGVSEEVNRERIADYLANIVFDDEYTFYRDIVRLPPAHTLTVSAEGKRLQRYWALDPDREVRYARDEDYAEAFREVFTEAVRCRLRAPDPVGAALSGGLDSSSIACVAQRVLAEERRPPLHAFSKIFDLVPECDERPYIKAVLQRGRYVSHLVPGDRENRPLSSVPAFVIALDQPCVGMFSSSEALLRRLQQEGVRVVLEGHGGDEVVSHGGHRLVELALKGAWSSLYREITLRDHDDTKAWAKMMLQYTLFGTQRRLAQHPYTRKLRRPLVTWLSRLSKHKNSLEERSRDALRYVNASLADEVSLAERLKVDMNRWGKSARSVREQHFKTLTHPLQALAHEEIDGVHAASGVQERSPFYDRRLLEMCLAFPADQKQRNGYGRFVLRQALQTALPEMVRDRRDKAAFQANQLFGVLHNEETALNRELSSLDELDRFAEVEVLREDLARVRMEEDWVAVGLLLRTTCLREWLGEE